MNDLLCRRILSWEKKMGFDTIKVRCHSKVLKSWNADYFDEITYKIASSDQRKRHRFTLAKDNIEYSYKGPKISRYPFSDTAIIELSSKHYSSEYPNIGLVDSNYNSCVDYINEMYSDLFELDSNELKKGIVQRGDIFWDVSKDLIDSSIIHILGYGHYPYSFEKIFEGNQSFLAFNNQVSFIVYDKKEEIVLKYIEKDEFKDFSDGPPNTFRVELRGKNKLSFAKLVLNRKSPVRLERVLSEEVQHCALVNFVSSIEFPRNLGALNEL